MIQNSVYTHLLDTAETKGGGLLLLIDPDATDEASYLALAEVAEDCGVDAILVGSSFTLNSNFANAVKKIKGASPLPVIIFPGSYAQVSPHADAILFSSLISGRNPSYLIDEQTKGAPLVKKFGVEPIPTGYMLIESGSLTSVQFISGTMPIPRGKTEIACAHALAAQYLGMKMVYLEAGSGASSPVPIEMISGVTEYIDIPVITGGGLRSPKDCAERIKAGASFVVIGNFLENSFDKSLLMEFADASHPNEKVIV